MLETLRFAQLNGEIETRDDALSLVRALVAAGVVSSLMPPMMRAPGGHARNASRSTSASSSRSGDRPNAGQRRAATGSGPAGSPIWRSSRRRLSAISAPPRCGCGSSPRPTRCWRSTARRTPSSAAGRWPPGSTRSSRARRSRRRSRPRMALQACRCPHRDDLVANRRPNRCSPSARRLPEAKTPRFCRLCPKRVLL